MNRATAQPEHYRAFTKAFFEKHQRTLLWLLNAKLTRRWFRWVLRIHRDCPETASIVEIAPNFYAVFAGYVKKEDGWHEQRIADFRTHEKYAKRLYQAFKPIWWTMHAWDIFADAFTPQLSFSFSTLTKFCDPDPATTAMNEVTARTGVTESFSTIRSGAGNYNTTSAASESPAAITSAGSSNNYDTIERGLFLFDTSSLTSNASVSAATFSLYVLSKLDNFSLAVAVTGCTPGSNTSGANSDYGQVGTTRYATDVAIASITTSAYNDFALNATGISNVSLTGITKIGVRCDKDADNSAPTWVASTTGRIVTSLANNAGTSQDPKLVVTYIFVKTLSQTITTTDTIVKTATKVLLQTITNTATILRTTSRSLAETITNTSVFTSTKIQFITLSDAITSLDTIIRTATKTLLETITNTAVLNRMISRLYTDSLTITGTMTRLVSKLLSESTSLLDSIINRLNGIRTIYTGAKYTTRSTSYNSKYTDRNTTYSNKYE